MTELELLKVIGYAQDVHILDANEVPEKRKILSFRPLIRVVAAVLAVALAVGLFLQTPAGVAAAEAVKEQMERFLDILFPPKEQVVYVEGVPETVYVEAQGREPEEKLPGFSIYVDTERYTMTEENGSWFIRPIHTPANSEDLPPLEMEIRELPELSPEEAAAMVHAEMEGKWDNLSEVWGYGRPETLCINASRGYGSDAPRERHDFKSNAKGGCFQIISRSYMEAAEGHGTRFYQMMKTFTLVAPQDTSQYADKADALIKAMQQEVAYAQELDAQYQNTIAGADTQTDMNISAYEREALWLDVHNKLWTALEQTLDEGAFLDLTGDEWDWATQKKQEIARIREEMGGGTLSGTELSSHSAVRIKERVLVLLNYLEGSKAPPAWPEAGELSPVSAVNAFVDAYFAGDSGQMQKYLSEAYSGETDSYATGKEEINAVKGLENIHRDMIHYGWLNVSVEFRPTADSDFFNYLSITLVWENHRWVVAFFGLEG